MSISAYYKQELEAKIQKLRQWKKKITLFFQPTKYRVWWKSDGMVTVIENEEIIYAYTRSGARKKARRLSYGLPYKLTRI